MATRAVRTQSRRVERAAKLGLVFRVTRQSSQLLEAVSELTFVAVLAHAALLERTTQLSLVARRVRALVLTFRALRL